MEHEYLTVGEAARLLRVSERTLYQLVRSGAVPGAGKVGGQWRLARRVLEGWVQEGGLAADPGAAA